MAGNPSVKKREKERARKERQEEKAVRRVERKEKAGTPGGGEPGEDPDIAGIVPGPQPEQELY